MQGDLACVVQHAHRQPTAGIDRAAQHVCDPVAALLAREKGCDQGTGAAGNLGDGKNPTPDEHDHRRRPRCQYRGDQFPLGARQFEMGGVTELTAGAPGHQT